MTFMETVQFRLKDGADEAAFLTAAFRMDTEFQPTQPGYVPDSRRTFRTADGNWMISVGWETQADSVASQKAFAEAGDITTDYVSPMDPTSVAINVYEVMVRPG